MRFTAPLLSFGDAEASCSHEMKQRVGEKGWLAVHKGGDHSLFKKKKFEEPKESLRRLGPFAFVWYAINQLYSPERGRKREQCAIYPLSVSAVPSRLQMMRETLNKQTELVTCGHNSQRNTRWRFVPAAASLLECLAF